MSHGPARCTYLQPSPASRACCPYPSGRRHARERTPGPRCGDPQCYRSRTVRSSSRNSFRQLSVSGVAHRFRTAVFGLRIARLFGGSVVTVFAIAVTFSRFLAALIVWMPVFASRTFAHDYDHGCPIALYHKARRAPPSRGYPSATCDYMEAEGLGVSAPASAGSPVSDACLR